MSDVTQILQQIEGGDPSAAEKLLPLVYHELRRLAAARMAAESPDHTLQATALVHEAYIRLVGGNDPPQWNSRGHFFAAAAEAMRRILVESARRKRNQRLDADSAAVDVWLAANRKYVSSSDEMLDLSDALDRLTESEPRAAEIVKLRFFAGLPADQISELLGQSPRTVRRSLTYAKAWLRRQMEAGSHLQ